MSLHRAAGTSPARAVSGILKQNELSRPDGRPLHGYGCSRESFDALDSALRDRIACPSAVETAPAAFVFWAAECIRLRFQGGKLTWRFLFHQLGCGEDQSAGRSAVDRGLRWWRRDVRKLDHGRMYLYSLLVEGGLPEALLTTDGLYKNVVMGLLREIEAEGSLAAPHVAEQIAKRRIQALPKTFHDDEFALSMAELSLALAKLRARVPEELFGASAERWIKKNCPEWESSVPLRMTSNAAASLIRHALRQERGPSSIAIGSLAVRELRLDDTGMWRPWIKLAAGGWIPDYLLPGVKGLRLRLEPIGVNRPPHYSATPEDGGWFVRRFGKRGIVEFPFSLDRSLAFSTNADGRHRGDVEIEAALPDPTESPVFWRNVAEDEGSRASRLEPHLSAAKTKAPRLWLLTAAECLPEADNSELNVERAGMAPNGSIWRVSGRGRIRLGEHWLSVRTGADDEAPPARIIASSAFLHNWRINNKEPIRHGATTFYGQLGAGTLRRLPARELRHAPSRTLYSEIVEWVNNNNVLARLRITSLPDSVVLECTEEAQGRLTCHVDGLDDGWLARLRAGDLECSGEVWGNRLALQIVAPNVPPAAVSLRLYDPRFGKELTLYTAWPAANGMLLDPEGARLAGNQPLSVDELIGWRAVAPAAARARIQLHLLEHCAISLPIVDDHALAVHLPVIRSMLSQGGPDAQVNLTLIVGGTESYRLEIRQYRESACMDNARLVTQLPRDYPALPGATAVSDSMKDRIDIHAVDIGTPRNVVYKESIDADGLPSLLGTSEGPWLIQLRVDGRAQRALIWSAESTERSTRRERIESYGHEWRHMILNPNDSSWDRIQLLIAAAEDGGSAAVLDRVQALAHAPVAALCLALRAPEELMPLFLELDTAAPIHWPTLGAAECVHVVAAERNRQIAKFARYFGADEAHMEANAAIAHRVRNLLNFRPELTGHLGWALSQAGLLPWLMGAGEYSDLLKVLLIAQPAIRLHDLAQAAAKRFDWLPSGLDGLEPVARLPEIDGFNRHAQRVIDAPLIAAEMAAGLRAPPDVKEKLTLVNLRFLDTDYFDKALPAAVHHLMGEQS